MNTPPDTPHADIPVFDPEHLANATADELIALMARHQDRVPRALFEAGVARGEAMIAALRAHFARCDAAADSLDEADPANDLCDWWLGIHAFWLAGAIPGEAAGRFILEHLPRVQALDDFSLDWVAGYMPWLFANKPAVCGAWARALAEDTRADKYVRYEAAEAAIGQAHGVGAEALEEALDWLARLLARPDDAPDFIHLAGMLLLDFPRARHRALLDRLAAEQDALDTWHKVFVTSDVSRAYTRTEDTLGWVRRGPPWDFYDEAKILARQERWREEAARADARAAEEAFDEDLDRLIPDTYVRETPKIGRNDPCPCGSGKKYKKCCLPAAETAATPRALF